MTIDDVDVETAEIPEYDESASIRRSGDGSGRVGNDVLAVRTGPLAKALGSRMRRECADDPAPATNRRHRGSESGSHENT